MIAIPSTKSLREMGLACYRARINKQLSQASLADEAGVSRASVHRLERGDDVSLRVMLRVAESLGLRLEVRP